MAPLSCFVLYFQLDVQHFMMIGLQDHFASTAFVRSTAFDLVYMAVAGHSEPLSVVQFDFEPDIPQPAMPKHPVSHERQQEIATLLGILDGAELDGALVIIKKDPSVNSDSDELELDFDTLSPMTISKLDKYLRKVKPEGSKMDDGDESSASDSSDDDN